MLADQRGGRLTHRRNCQRPEYPAGSVSPMGMRDSRPANEIAVGSCPRPESRMKVGRNLARPLHRDGLGQTGIDTSDPGGQWTPCLGIEVNDLRQRMNAGIGAPGADRRHTMAGKRRQGNFNQILDRVAGRLGLPTGKSGTVIGQTERQPHDRRRTTIRPPQSRSGR